VVPYRTEAEAGLPLDKLAPFREDEGMSFARHPGHPGIEEEPS
jgi:hypothetical protein